MIIDEVPVLFINKGKGVDYVAGKIDCQGYEFKLITNSNGKYHISSYNLITFTKWSLDGEVVKILTGHKKRVECLKLWNNKLVSGNILHLDLFDFIII